MSADGEQAPFWGLDEIQKWARMEFPAAFERLPQTFELDFEDRSESSKLLQPYQKEEWPPGTIRKMLHVGSYDAQNGGSESNDRVYVYIHGENQNRVGYAKKSIDTIDYEKVSTYMMKDITFESPFADLGDGSEPTASRGRLRGLACYFFLAAGHVKMVGYYSTFTRELAMACAWIANDGARPKWSAPKSTPGAAHSSRDSKQIGNSSRENLEDSLAQSSKAQDIQTPITRAREKRQTTEEHGSSQHESNDGFRSLYSQVEVCYTSIENENKRLRTDLEIAQVENLELKMKHATQAREISKIRGEFVQEEIRCLDMSQNLRETEALLAVAQKRAEEAEAQATNLCSSDYKQAEAKWQKWQAKAEEEAKKAREIADRFKTFRAEIGGENTRLAKKIMEWESAE